MKRLLPFLFFCFFFSKGFATQWGYDTTFGTKGKVIIDSMNIIATQLQSDGKIIALGSKHSVIYDNRIGKTYLYRFNQNGRLDTTFYKSGVFQLENCFANLAIQSDDKILLGGEDTLNYTHILHVRLMPDGSPDTSYYSDSLRMPFGVHMSQMKIRTDGKLIFAGESANSHDSAYVVVRLNTDGTLDSNFGIKGIYVFNSLWAGILTDMLVQKNNEILLASTFVYQLATTNDPFSSTLCLVRLKKDGGIDSTFGNNGKIRHLVNANNGRLSFKGVMLNNGKTVFAGADVAFDALRINPDGTKDSTFHSWAAYSTKDFPYFNGGTGIAKDSAERLYFGTSLSYPWPNIDGDFTILRTTEDGKLDSSFNRNGFLSSKISNDSVSDKWGHMMLQADGKILLTAKYSLYSPYVMKSFIVRFMPNSGAVTSAESTLQYSPKFFLSPNPTKENATLQYHMAVPSDLYIEIFDIQERKLKTVIHRNITSLIGKEEISLRDFPQGIYILSIICGSERKTMKFVKE